MALTLIEAAKKHSGDVFQQAVIELFSRETDILRVLPMIDIKGGALKYKLEDTLPGIAFRGIGEAYTESTGVINPQTESLVIAGGDIDVDRFIVKTMGEDQRTAQESMKIKALSHNYSNTFIKGDTLTTPKQFDGLQVRLTGNQVISNGSVFANSNLSLAKLDEAIDAVDDPNYILTTKVIARRLTAAARSQSVGGFISYGKDEFGRRVTKYNDLPLLIADKNSDLFATLGDNEASPDSSTATSLYVLALREGMLSGLQNGIPEVTDLGQQDSKSVFRTRIEWYTGLIMQHPRAAARLRDINSALAVVA